MDINDLQALEKASLETNAEGVEGERQISRQEFAKLLGLGVAGISVGGAFASSALAGSAQTRAPASASANKTIAVNFQSSLISGYVQIANRWGEVSNATPIKLKGIPSNAYDLILPRLVAAGTVADIFEISPGSSKANSVQTFGSLRALVDLSREPWVKKIPKSFLPVCSRNGTVHMAPVRGGVMVVFYNKSMFNSFGLQPPTTWPEFLAVCEKLKAGGKIPIWLDASNATIGGAASVFLTYPLVASTDAGVADWGVRRKTGKVSFANSSWRTSLQSFMTLHEKGYFSPNATGGAPLSQLATNQAAMYCYVSQGLPAATAGFGVGNVGSFVLPNAPTAARVVACSGPGNGLAISSKSKDQAAAKAFIRFVASPLGQKIFNANTGSFPILPASPGAVGSALMPIVPFLRAGRTSPYYDQLWPNPAVQRALISGTQNLMNGQGSIADVLEAMDDEYARR